MLAGARAAVGARALLGGGRRAGPRGLGARGGSAAAAAARGGAPRNPAGRSPLGLRAPGLARQLSGADVEAREALTYRLTRAASRAVEEVVPFFLENMPESYFQRVSQVARDRHLQAVAALRTAGGVAPQVTLESADVDELVFVRPGDGPGMLHRIVSKHVPLRELQSVWCFTSKDHTLALNVFQFEERDIAPEVLAEATERVQQHAAAVGYPADRLARFLAGCRDTEVATLGMDPECFLRMAGLYHEASGSETPVGFIDAPEGSAGAQGQFTLGLAVPNVTPKFVLERLSQYFEGLGININTCDLCSVKDGGNGFVVLVNMGLSDIDGDGMGLDTEEGKAEFVTQVKRVAKWLDNRVLELMGHLSVVNHGEGEQDRCAQAEAVVAFCNLLHGKLSRVNPHAFSRTRIFEMALDPRFLPTTLKIAELFVHRFNPVRPLTDEDYAARRGALLEQIGKLDLEEAQVLLGEMVGAVDATLRTNLYLHDRYALALRLEPEFLGHGHATVGDDTPYGAFFVNGRRFNGFHVRFADIARGGMRVVTPRNAELHAIGSTTHYTECYSLAYAQQLKNKDIPEGGAKAVVLVEPHNYTDAPADTADFIRKKSVKAFANSILDLILDREAHPETASRIVDRYGRPETVYFGPDEQITPEDILWMVKHAADRGYSVPSAFMSSKPDTGINHKEYGVTSEGVAVFLGVALKASGVDTEKPFRVSMTGGPDGDVGGNMLKILSRDYGKNAQVVGICDGTATVEDEGGIDLDELLRLMRSNLPLADFDADKLGRGGRFALADTTEGRDLRNTMHNRVKADVLVPCGGRPATINEDNWRGFLGEDGEPACPLIVEGANLFITPGAREALFQEAGVAIVKDSSANKCGVICSSYEIAASMLLSREEFLENKEAIVQGVLDKLRVLAEQEAQLLFRQQLTHPEVSLPNSSVEISAQILRTHGAILEAMDSFKQDLDYEVMLDTLAREHLPEAILNLGGGRLKEQCPEAYLHNLIASSLASRVVYKEGLEFVAQISDGALGEVALQYLTQEQRVNELIGEVEASGVKHSAEIKELLLKGGIRAAVMPSIT